MPHITDKLVRAMKPPADKSQSRYLDDEIKGFGLRVTQAGTKTFILNYTANGRERRMSIGKYPAWSVAAARERARDLRRLIDMGGDPLGDHEKQKQAPTFVTLWSRYEADVLTAKATKTALDQRSLAMRFLLPEFGTKRVDTITYSEVERLHLRLSRETPVQANRVLALTRHVFSKAKRWGVVQDNPASGIRCNYEAPRERFLDDGERLRFQNALAEAEPTAANLAIEMIFLTGARKSEVLRASWDQFDLHRGIWSKPSSHTKQRRTHTVPINRACCKVLERAKELGSDEFVFPGPRGGPIQDIRRAFAKLCYNANIDDFRPHDLRHSFASLLARSGTDLHTVGKLLGHTQYATTQRYSHLQTESLRHAAELASTS